MLLLKVTASRAPPGHSYTARSGSALYRYRSCAGTFILLHRGTPLQRPAEIQYQFRDHGRLLTLTRQAAAPQAMQARTFSYLLRSHITHCSRSAAQLPLGHGIHTPRLSQYSAEGNSSADTAPSVRSPMDSRLRRTALSSWLRWALTCSSVSSPFPS